MLFRSKGKSENLETLLLAYNAGKNENKSTWFLDSIYSSHMCGKEEMLSKLDKTSNLEVQFGNDIIVLVKDKGKIFIQLNKGS